MVNLPREIHARDRVLVPAQVSKFQKSQTKEDPATQEKEKVLQEVGHASPQSLQRRTSRSE